MPSQDTLEKAYYQCPYQENHACHLRQARHDKGVSGSTYVGGVGARVERVGSNGERVAGGLRDGVGL